MTSKTDALGNVTTYTYYPTGLVASVTDARLNTTSYTYNWRGQLLTTTHADGSMTGYQYDSFGNRTAVTDELGHTTTYTYDEYNRVKTMADPLGRTTTYEYGRAPGCNSCSYANTLTRITSPAGRMTTYSYDAGGLRTCQTVGAGTADAATTTYTYDSAKNLISVTDPRGKIWRYTYDDQHRKLSAIGPLGNQTQWTYDEHGNKLTETRPDGGVTQFVYDARNRLIEATDPAGHITQMTYDSADNLLNLTDARNNTYSFAYDALKRKTSLTYPDGSHEDYAYDAVGNLITYTTRAGQVKTSTYDNRNRETAFTWSDGTPGATKTYDAAGRILTINSSISSLSYVYDNANQLLSETEDIAGGPGAKTVGYSYGTDGNRATLIYPDGSSVAYAYTNRAQLSSVTSAGDSAALVTYAYDLGGLRTSKILQNGVTSDYSYDDAQRLTEIKHWKGPTVLAQFDYTVDPVGNRTQKVASGTLPNRTENYDYDAIDQVTLADYGSRSETFQYDAVGNRTSVADSASGTTDYSANNLNQYTAVGSNIPIHDGNGNLSSYSSWTFGYDATSRMLSATNGATTAAFGHDARNRQVSRTINGMTTYFIYDGWNLLAEYGANGLVTKYIHGSTTDEIIAKTDSTSTMYYHHDGVGSTVALSDSAGALVESYQYDVFGKPTIYDASGGTVVATAYNNRFLFTGREYLAQLCLYDYRNRIYSPELGRFLQMDPIRFSSGDMNLYRYVNNSATTASDPEGLKTCWRFLDIVTHFGDRPEDTYGIRGHRMQSGEIAVGQWSNNRFIRGANTAEIEANQDRYMVLPYGARVWLFVSGNESGRYQVTDYGAYDKDHPQYAPDNWADIYNPAASANAESYDDGGWEAFDIPDDECCPDGSSQYPEGAPGEGAWPGSYNV